MRLPQESTTHHSTRTVFVSSDRWVTNFHVQEQAVMCFTHADPTLRSTLRHISQTETAWVGGKGRGGVPVKQSTCAVCGGRAGQYG